MTSSGVSLRHTSINIISPPILQERQSLHKFDLLQPALGGYIFDSYLITYTSSHGSSFGLSYLGRPYSNYSVVVYKNSYLDRNINSAGWSVWQTSNPQTNNVLFGEYNNVGPSSWRASTTNLTDSQVAAYWLHSWEVPLGSI